MRLTFIFCAVTSMVSTASWATAPDTVESEWSPSWSSVPQTKRKADKRRVDDKRRMIDSLKGSKDLTQLPDTARHDQARGGVFI
jgi:hypothetical protein